MIHKKLSVILAGSTILIWGPVLAVEDHADISGPFASPMEVTQACLECHENASLEIMATTHWTLENKQVLNEKEIVRGKKNALNNFHISFNANTPGCSNCHVGYGYTDATFDFSDQRRVDCLVCHDTTGTYLKPLDALTNAGKLSGYTRDTKYDDKSYKLETIAHSAGLPARQNCLICHANGGGGNGVKHGDIDMSLVNPAYELDVHMSPDGNNFSCQECHTSEEHQIKGNTLLASPGGNNSVSCNDCHEDEPHIKEILNNHLERIACQTCHIPTFARKHATQMSWDWSTAQDPKNLAEDRKFITKEDNPVYLYTTGDLIWKKNVIPEYHWYNGSAGVYTIGDKIDPAIEIGLNHPLGSRNGSESKIAPFKTHRAIQLYDSENMYLATPKLFSTPEDNNSFWVHYDWHKALEAGMKANSLPYSGKYGWAKTVSYWPITHMVAPAANALRCVDCHSEKGRLDWKALGYKDDPKRMEK